MNKDQCCNHECNQGRKCPVREGTHKPAEAVHQIQEPTPVTAMDALREAEAALEVAIARILKADPSHSICVTSEAKALVAVRAALAATPAAAPVVLPEPDDSEFEQQLPIQPIGVMGGGEARKVLWNCTFMPEAGTSFYTEQQVRALLAAAPFGLQRLRVNPAIEEEAIFVYGTEKALANVVALSLALETAKKQIEAHTAPAPANALATGGQAQAVLTGELIEAVDAWFARNTGLGGCSDKDVAELAAIFAAPQQADARDAGQERWMGIGKAIERACVDLPAGAEINIHLEKDAGTVTLSDCDGDEQENFPTDEGLAGVVNAAIDAAIAAAKGSNDH